MTFYHFILVTRIFEGMQWILVGRVSSSPRNGYRYLRSGLIRYRIGIRLDIRLLFTCSFKLREKNMFSWFMSAQKQPTANGF